MSLHLRSRRAMQSSAESLQKHNSLLTSLNRVYVRKSFMGTRTMRGAMGRQCCDLRLVLVFARVDVIVINYTQISLCFSDVCLDLNSI